MPKAVKTPRSYSSPLRAEQAAATRQQVLDAARQLFTTRGYAATTVGQVAVEKAEEVCLRPLHQRCEGTVRGHEVARQRHRRHADRGGLRNFA